MLNPQLMMYFESISKKKYLTHVEKMQSEFINCNSYLSNCSLKPLELKVSNFNILIDEKLQNLKKEGWEIKLLEDKSRLYYKLYLGILPHIKDSSNKMILSILLELNKKSTPHIFFKKCSFNKNSLSP